MDQAVGDWFFYAILVFVFLSYYIAFRRYIFFIYDPIVFFAVSLSFASTLVIWLFLNGHIEAWYFLTYTLCVLAFMCGFLVIPSIYNKIKYPPILQVTNETWRLLSTINLVLVIASAGIVTLKWKYVGLAILSQNPLLDRVALATSSRWLDFLGSGVFPLAVSSTAFIAFSSGRRRTRLLGRAGLVVMFLVYLTHGSRGALLNFMFSMAAALILLKRMQGGRARLNYNLPLMAILGAAFVYAFGVMYLSGFGGHIFYHFIRRFVSYGDTYIYYFAEDLYNIMSHQYDLVTYLLHPVTKSVANVKLFEFNIGTALYGAMFGDYSGYGPNPHFTVEGMVMLGYFGAPAYSLFIGVLTSILRFIPTIMLSRVGAFGLLVSCIMLGNVGVLPADITLFQSYFLSGVGTLVVAYWISKLILFSTDLVRSAAVPKPLPIGAGRAHPFFAPGASREGTDSQGDDLG